MSDPEPGGRRWDWYVRDMLEACERIRTYTDGLNRAAFVADERTYDATLRNLEILGEAATHIPAPVRESHGEIPWRAVSATRNQVIHAYLGIDDDINWSIIQDDIPELAPLLVDLLAEAEASGGG